MLREYNSGDGGLDDNVEMMTTTTVMTKMMGAKVMMLTMFFFGSCPVVPSWMDTARRVLLPV